MRPDFFNLRRFFTVAALTALCRLSPAAVPLPEKILPDNTLVVVTAPDFSKLRSIWEKLPQKQLWGDPAMKPFRENFVTTWKEQVVKPLERELDIKLEDYTSLLQGQLTLALIQDGFEREGQPAGLVLLLDTKDKSTQLKKNLAAVRKKWTDAGKPIKTVKIRDADFTVLPVSSNDIPKTIRKFIPKSPEVHELGEEEAKPASETDELLLGQVDSLLIISTSRQAVEKVLARLSGGSVPALSEVAAYQADHVALFRDAPLYGWINLKVFVDTFTRKLAQRKQPDNPEAPNPFEIKPEKIFGAIGLGGLRSLAFTYQPSAEGSTAQVFLRVPESARHGLFRILTGEPRETRPPPFIPADVLKFRRWRLDGQKTWETLQRMISDISPQWLNGINFLLDTANTAAREKDPGFDIKKNLIGNLGDDIISYEKRRGKSGTDLSPAPTLFLLGSPNSERLALALKSILIFGTAQSGSAPEEREFLGRKIYSVSPRSMLMPLGAGAGGGVPGNLSYAASGGYVAFSSEPALLEEYLRSTEGPQKSLKETPGLAEAAQKVVGPNSSLFGYENNVETMRSTFEALRKNGAATGPNVPSPAANLIPGGINIPAAVQTVRELADFSLLPEFDKIAKYFHFTVYGGSADVDGLTLKMFAPWPPELKK